MKRILGIIGLFILVLSGCQSESDPLADGVLTIGLEADYAPYNWTTTAEKGTDNAVQLSGTNSYVDGYDVAIAQKVADDLGVELEVKKIAWDGLIPALQANEIDAIIAGMSPTEERREQVNFTDPYYEDGSEQKIIVSSNSKYKDATTLADLDGANITAQMGTFQVDLLDQINLSSDAQSPLPDYASLIQATTSGTIDGYIAEEQVADAQVKENDSLIELSLTDGLEVDPDQTSTAIGVAKDATDLQKQINESLAKISDEERETLMAEANKESK